MSFPVGVTTCTLTLGHELDSIGTAGVISGSVFAVLPAGMQHIYWTATGDSLRTGVALATDSTDDLSLTCVVPAVDQAGWAAPGGAAVTNWSYLVSGIYTDSQGGQQRFSIPVQPLSSQTQPIDLDTMLWTGENPTLVPPSISNATGVTSINGITGAITIPDVIPDPPVTLNGTTAGTAVSLQPFGGASFKKFLVYLNGYENTTGVAQTITYPIAFSHTPRIVADDAGVAASTSTLTLPTSMSAPVTGWVTLEGF